MARDGVINSKGDEMTKTQFEKKFNRLWHNASKTARDEALRLFKSGGINTSKYEDDFLLPRVIFSAVCSHLKSQFAPFSGHEREVANLRHF